MSRYGAALVLAFGLLSTCVGDVGAQRQGFIAGAGVGPGWQLLDLPSPQDTHFGLSIDLKLGSQIGRSWQVYFRQWVLRSVSGERYPWFTSMTGIGASYEFPRHAPSLRALWALPGGDVMTMAGEPAQGGRATSSL